MGAKKRPFYRIVVADTRSPRNGRFIESLGFYDPLPDPARITVDADKVTEWLRKGARPTESARHVLQRQGILAAAPLRSAPADGGKPRRAAASEQPVGPAAEAAAEKEEPAE
jgi:small subunit ribosomal protein S16